LKFQSAICMACILILVNSESSRIVLLIFPGAISHVCCVKISSKGKSGGKVGKFALASIRKEASNEQKDPKVYCPQYYTLSEAWSGSLGTEFYDRSILRSIVPTIVLVDLS